LCYDSDGKPARRRLFPYLLLNIFVSALVTGTIIFFYDRAHKADCIQTTPGTGAATAYTSEIDVSIEGVIGAGTAADERVVIKNNGSSKLILSGWYLEDNQGITYTFPATPELTLYPGASVLVHTRSGTDIPPDLYWGRTQAVWISGELAALYDPAKIARAFYRVP